MIVKMEVDRRSRGGREVCHDLDVVRVRFAGDLDVLLPNDTLAEYQSQVGCRRFGVLQVEVVKHGDELYPDADPFAWRIKRHTYTDAEAARIESALEVELYPEERLGEFYIALSPAGRILGVATFIDPRSVPKILDDAILSLDVGVGVDLAGRIDRVRLYGYRGNEALTKDDFLQQLHGRTLASSFVIDTEGLASIEDEVEESQLVATAAQEALLFMKVALGRRQ